MKSLIQTFSKPDERECQVTVYTKLNSSSLREMNGYLDVWNNETGGKFPPQWLQNFSLEKEQKIAFSLNYDLLKKDWFGTNVRGGYTPAHLESYRTATSRDLMDVIKRIKNSEEERRIASQRNSSSLGPAKGRDLSGLPGNQESVSMLQERAKATERMKIENIEKEKKSNELTKVSEKFMECVESNLGSRIEYPTASKRFEEEGTVVFHIEFIDGIYNSAKIINTPYKRLGDAVLAALPKLKLNCSEVEKVTGSVRMNFIFALI